LRSVLLPWRCGAADGRGGATGTEAPGSEGASAVRTDRPLAADGLADREALSERTSDRSELAQRLARLPPGHPSSPVEADGKPRPPEPGLAWREWRDAEHAEHVGEVEALLDKARAEGRPLTSATRSTRRGRSGQTNATHSTTQSLRISTRGHPTYPASAGPSSRADYRVPGSRPCWKAMRASTGRST
jgi:hypothetical protein